MWSLLLLIAGLPVVISTVIIEGRTIEISFDWSVSCPPTPSGIVNLTTVVSLYNSIIPDLFNPDFPRRLAGTETLSYTSSSSSHFHTQHHQLQIPLRAKCEAGERTGENGRCRNFGFRWSSVLLNETTNCCWSVSNVTITSINKNDPNGIIYQSVVDICYQQQPYQYNNMTWVCPYNNNNNTGDEDSGLVQFESDIIEYVISTDNPHFRVQSSCTNIVVSHNSGLPHRQVFSPSYASSVPLSPSSSIPPSLPLSSLLLSSSSVSPSPSSSVPPSPPLFSLLLFPSSIAPSSSSNVPPSLPLSSLLLFPISSIAPFLSSSVPPSPPLSSLLLFPSPSVSPSSNVLLSPSSSSIAPSLLSNVLPSLPLSSLLLFSSFSIYIAPFPSSSVLPSPPLSSLLLVSSSSVFSSTSSNVLLSPSSNIAPSPSSNVPPSPPLSSLHIFPSSSISPSPSSSVPLTPSSVSVMIPLSAPLPDPVCVADGVWPQTKAGTNVTLSREVKECFNGTVEASRLCGSNGEWNNVTCLSSSTFKMALEKVMESPVDGLGTLQEILPEVPLVQSVFLFSTALNTVLETSDNGNISRQLFTEIFLNITDSLISGSANNEFITQNEDTRSAGSQLLVTLDRFTLEFATANIQTETEELILNVVKFDGSVAINSSITSVEDSQNNSITLPQEIFTPGNKIRIGSFIFRNLSHLLPPVDTNSSIISPIISSTIDCQSCPVTNLTQNVTIQLRIERSPSRKEILECVFFDFIIRDGLLPTGDWSTSGCTTVTVAGDLVTCSCNHLTHFAILLSPGGPEISPIHYKVLTTIGLVLVPISLLCMVMVILTYSLIRSLWSLRNYVHIMLCVSLFMAQLVFIIGVDKIENQGVCSAVAVILVYLFLVTFMWMLMEGVVLYVTLVRVFITNQKYYAISFTVASYVIPAVYMAVIIPIGYLINVGDIPDHTHFLYYHETDDDNVPSLTACWVNYSTGFVWSFIAPVIVIILANVGFFIMALVIAKRHSTTKQSIGTEIRQWILATISLTVVMGIAWLVGVMAFRRELLPVAYITAIFIAAQGIILFIILVPLSYKARKAYTHMWAKKKRTLSAKFSDFSSPFNETKPSTSNVYSALNLSTLLSNPNTSPRKESSFDNGMPKKSNMLPAGHLSPPSTGEVDNGYDSVTATTKSHPIHEIEQVVQHEEQWNNSMIIIVNHTIINQ